MDVLPKKLKYVPSSKPCHAAMGVTEDGKTMLRGTDMDIQEAVLRYNAHEPLADALLKLLGAYFDLEDYVGSHRIPEENRLAAMSAKEVLKALKGERR